MNNEKIDDLIIRYLTGECSPEEEKELLAWSTLSDENANYFQQIKYVWLSSVQLEDEKASRADFSPDVNDLDFFKASRKKGLFVPTINLIRIAKYAAVFIFIFLLGWAGSLFLSKSGSDSSNAMVNSFEIPIGSKGRVVLPDGTKVWLNAGSKLSYNENYNLASREVKLIGEAYFDVKTNPSKPFTVKAGKLAIKALGTSFNVKAYPEDPDITTTLIKGSVIIEGKDAQNKNFKINLRPNQSVSFVKNNKDELLASENQGSTADNRLLSNEKRIEGKPLINNRIKVELYTSWKDENWVIEKQPLGELVKDLERRYNISIEFTSETLKKYRFSGIIQNETIEQLMDIMHKAMPVKYSIERGRVILSEDRTLMTKLKIEK